MFLQTKHLTIRELGHDDLDALCSLFGNSQVMHYSIAGTLSCEQTRDYLEKRILGHYAQFGFGLWAVVHTQDRRVIGCAGLLHQLIDGEDLVELGYRLLPEYWGKGLASEAARAISHYAFDQLHLDQIISIIDPKNTRSMGVATRLGMRYWKEGVFHKIPVQIYILGKVVVAPYDPSWAKKFAVEEKFLKSVFKDLDIALFHIGSTSLPGCSAKPVIDILGITADILEIDRCNPEMAASGFRAFGEHGMKQRRFFQRQTGTPVNLHIFESTDPEAGRHLRFCNYLRSHPDLIKEYSALKTDLSRQFPHDIQKYILGKEKWIKNVDRKAAWEAPLENVVQKKVVKKKQWTLKEIRDAFVVNWNLHKTCFAKFVPALEIVFEPDVTVIRSQIPDDSFNVVLSARFTEKNAAERIAHVLNHFTEFPLPPAWWVGCTDTPSPLGDLLCKQGFTLQKKIMGMYLELGEWASPPLLPLIFKRVESSEELKHFADLTASARGASSVFDSVYSQLPPVIYCGSASLEFHLGWEGNIPVAAGILLSHANIVGIYNVVATQSGFASAIVKHLLDLAKAKGYFIASVESSENEIPLYESLGFKECCQFSKYTKET